MLRTVAWGSSGALAWVASPASAHVVGPVGGGDFATGFAHPFFGADHLLAMLAIGLWSWLQRGRRRAALPALFVAGVAAGLGAGALAVAAPVAPAVLAGSAAALGLCVALALRTGFGLAVVAGLAGGILHGNAHASDLAASASPAWFAAGFLSATALLHALGFVLCAGAPERARVVWARAAGSAVAVAGAWLLAVAL